MENEESLENVESISDEECKPPEPSPRSVNTICKELLSVRGLTARQERIIGKHTLTPKHLATGFGIHTHRSLELAIQASKQPVHICKCLKCESDSDLTKSGSVYSHASLASLAQNQLRFLMGLEGEVIEEESEAAIETEVVEQTSEDFITGGTASMRQAQRYLREHKIFEFYQFLIAHLLSENAFDPINFLINILDKCLIYRSGMAEPPLLYDKKHINCLFNLMDRMRSGFIDRKQYQTGMHTLGIKSYNPKPPLTADGMVSKSFFVEEAHECLKDLLNDMLRKRCKHKPKHRKVPKAPPPSQNCSIINFDKK